MDETCGGGDSLAILKRLVADIGTPQLLRLIADVAEQHANDLIRQGISPHAARFARDAKILSRAAEAIPD
jgi:hypothetical protein